VINKDFLADTDVFVFHCR